MRVRVFKPLLSGFFRLARQRIGVVFAGVFLLETGVLGTVVSTVDGPSTASFSFVVSGSAAGKGLFVTVECDRGGGLFVGCVREIVRSNRYFERAESVSEYERGSAENGSFFGENFPVSDWEVAVANCSLLGVFAGSGKLGRAVFPPKPGEKVREAGAGLLEKFLGFRQDGLHLGKLAQHDVEVRVGLAGLLQKHLAILAMSGAGKSVLSSVILEELLSRKAGDGRIAAVVFDVHGEYGGFARDAEFSKKTKMVNCEEVKISCRHLSAGLLRELSGATKKGSREFEKILKQLSSGDAAAFELEDVEKAVDESGIGENVKAALKSALYELGNLGLFGKTDHPSAMDLARPGELVIFDFSETVSQKKKQVIVSHFGRKLFQLRRQGKVPPFVLLVEEAHNFAPQNSEAENAVSRGIIETIAREGRKFGACLCLVSQRPVHLSTTALSQCNSFIIMRMTNPNDVQRVGESCEAIDAGALGQITTLQVGEGMIVGEAAPVPFFARFRDRRSKEVSSGKPLEEIAKKFEESEGKRRPSKEDAEAFV